MEGLERVKKMLEGWKMLVLCIYENQQSGAWFKMLLDAFFLGLSHYIRIFYHLA